MSLVSRSPWRLLATLGIGLALATLALVDPASWLVVASLLVLAVAVARWVHPDLVPGTRRELAKYALGLGVGVPVAFFASVRAFAGADSARAIASALRPARLDAFAASGYALLALCFVAVALAALDGLARERTGVARRSSVEGARWLASALALACVAVCGARLVRVLSVATVPTDLLIWSEPPFLIDMLKLRTGGVLYGPMGDANSYSYSPGVQLLHYTLLRPFGLELSLGAHRALGLGFQALGTALLSAVLWRRCSRGLAAALGKWALPALVASLGAVMFGSFLAPHVHPDHALIFCFSLALALVLREPRSKRRLGAALLLLPAAATVFKLTGAGIGLGLVLSYAWERRFRELGLLAVGGLLALATIPLFDLTLGQFSAYAIRLQASHPIEWARLGGVLATPAGGLCIVALAALAALRRAADADGWKLGLRVFWVTLGFALPSLVAYAKRGGRDNSLLPLAIGSSVIVILAVGELAGARARRGAQPAVAGALLFLALAVSFPRPPLAGAPRSEILAIQARATRWVQEETAAGRRPLLAFGTAAWLGAGRRDVPRDQLTSASELFLGGRPELSAYKARLFGETYDGLFVSASALFSNALLATLRADLERRYRVVEPEAGRFPRSNSGYAILVRRP